MTIQVVTLSVEEMQGFVADAYKEGYIKAQREWEKKNRQRKMSRNFLKQSEVVKSSGNISYIKTIGVTQSPL